MLIDLKLGYVFYTSLLSQDVGPISTFSGSWTTESFTFQIIDARRTQFPWMAYMRASVSHSCQMKADSSSEKPVAIPWLLNMSTYFLMANQ